MKVCFVFDLYFVGGKTAERSAVAETQIDAWRKVLRAMKDSELNALEEWDCVEQYHVPALDEVAT